ncbi:MAG: ABC transporter permease [Actinomycetota bacterium]
MQTPPLHVGQDAPIDVDLGEGPPPIPPGKPRRLVWTRRRASVRRFWRAFRKDKMGVAGLVILAFFIGVAIFAVIAGPSGTRITEAVGEPLQPPSRDFPFGTDDQGRSVLTLTIQGAKVSLLVGLSATAITMVIGSVIGLAAGFRGGSVDSLLMRITDWGLVIPWLVLAISLASIFGQSLFIIVLVIGLTTWPSTARLVRAQTLSVKERPYIERARALGASNWHIVTRHVLPNVMPVIMANTVLIVAIAILSETALSFLGLGDPFSISWGQILEQANNAGASTLGAWWWLGAPGVSIVLVVLSFTMIGFALDQIINPRLRDR